LKVQSLQKCVPDDIFGSVREVEDEERNWEWRKTCCFCSAFELIFVHPMMSNCGNLYIPSPADAAGALHEYDSE